MIIYQLAIKPIPDVLDFSNKNSSNWFARSSLVSHSGSGFSITPINDEASLYSFLLSLSHSSMLLDTNSFLAHFNDLLN